MFVKAKNVIGLKVVTIRRGREIDDIQDVIYDPEKNKVVALLVDKGGWFSDAKVILIENVKNIGKDAVVIESSDVLTKASDVEEKIQKIAKSDTYLTKTRVMTEDGNDLGKISDIYFDVETGEVTEFEVSEGAIKDMQSGKKSIRLRDIVTVGKDVTIVKAYTEANFEEQANEQGLQGTLNQGKDTASSLVEKAGVAFEKGKEKAVDLFEDGKEKASEIAEQSKEKFEEMKNNPENKQKLEDLKEKVSEVSQGVKEKAIEAKDAASEKFSDVKDTVSEKASEAKDTVTEKAGEIKDKAQEKKEEIETDKQQGKRNDAVGRFLTKTILAPDDKPIGKEGEMITNEMLKEAEAYGLEDDILENYSKEPVMSHIQTSSEKYQQTV